MLMGKIGSGTHFREMEGEIENTPYPPEKKTS